MPLKKLTSLKKDDLKNKKVLMRVDFNVPIENGKVVNDERIIQALGTIKYIIENEAALVICSHLGRPKGNISEEFRLDPVAFRLGELLGQEVKKVDDCIGPEAELGKQNLKSGEILLLENTRFHTGETENTREFSRSLASGCDLFVEDAFGSIHRAHASTVGVAHLLPSYLGFLIEKEVEILSKVLKNPEKPLCLIMGGAKIGTKIGVIRHFLKTADSILIGGGLANTFLYAQGFEIGDSLCEKTEVELARELLEESEKLGGKIKLPVDVITAKDIHENADFFNVSNENVGTGDKILDIGKDSIKFFSHYINNAKTIIWNGPMGLFEREIFSAGTREIAQAIAKSNSQSIIGGGDTTEAIDNFGIAREKYFHISTGGGAMLEFLEGKILPGLSVLKS